MVELRSEVTDLTEGIWKLSYANTALRQERVKLEKGLEDQAEELRVMRRDFKANVKCGGS